METENLEVKKEESKPKKKRNWLFTLFACIATAIIVILAMNIGQNLSKTVDPDTNKSNNDSNEVVEEEKDNNESNINVDSNSNSNQVSNNTSNQTSNNTPTKEEITYTEKDIVGHYAVTITTNLKNESNETIIEEYELSLYANGMYRFGVEVNGPSCGYGTDGNFYVIDNKILLNPLFMNHCEVVMATGEAQISGIVKSNSEITLNYGSEQITLKKVTDSEKLKNFTSEKDFIKEITDSFTWNEE